MKSLPSNNQHAFQNQLNRFESHLEAILEQLRRCLEGIADNRSSLNALRESSSSGVARVHRSELRSAQSRDGASLRAPPEHSALYSSAISRVSAYTDASSHPQEVKSSRERDLRNLQSERGQQAMELMRERRESAGGVNAVARDFHRRKLAESFSSVNYGVTKAFSLKQRQRSSFAVELWNMLNQPVSSRRALWANRITVFLSCFSIVLTFLNSGTTPTFGFEGVIVELVCDTIFSLEFLCRFYSCPSRGAFLKEIYTVFEFVASFPIFAVRVKYNLDGPLEPSSWPYWILVALVPLLRSLMMLRRFEQIHLQVSAFRSALEALPVMLYTQVILIAGFAAIIFLVEPRWNISSFGDALWFTIVTSYTVGYGDVYPETNIGQLVAGCLMICSSLYMAIPIGIVGDAFSRVWAEREALLLVRRISARLRLAKVTPDVIPSLFFRYDEDENGRLSRTEFVNMVHSMHVDLDTQQALDLFNVIDVDGSGEISDAEFIQVLYPSDFKHMYSAIHTIVDMTKIAIASAIPGHQAMFRTSTTNQFTLTNHELEPNREHLTSCHSGCDEELGLGQRRVVTSHDL